MPNSHEPDQTQPPETSITADQTEHNSGGEGADHPSDEEDIVHLPSPAASESAKPQPEPEYDGARFRGFDFLLMALTVFLGFWLASFAIRNHDYWLHLAVGRHLAQNLSGLWSDPFTSLAANELWVNHAWLSDLVFYWLYSMSGDAGMVVAKGVIVALIALVMLQTRDKTGSAWIAAVCVSLALLAMSQRFLFQPVLLSLLYLALTFYLLQREPRKTDSGWSFAFLWALPLLFVLWVNTDSWFILGPITVLLALIGEGIQMLATPKELDKFGHRQKVMTLGLVFVVGLLACLVNPYFHQAFRMPTELAYLLRDYTFVPDQLIAAGRALQEIEQYDRLSTNVGSATLTASFSQALWSPRFYEPLRHFENIPGICYIVLLVIGLLSFIGLLIVGNEENHRSSFWPRLLVWLFFSLLSVSMVRLIPLFAVVAGSITALNCQETLRGLWPHMRIPARFLLLWGILGRLATFAGMVGLLFLIWPGWLRGTFGQAASNYRVEWRAKPDAALKEAALWLADWHKKGNVKSVYNTEPDVGCYLAWHAPDVKYYFDYRFDLFLPKASEIGKIRYSLRPVTAPKTLKQKQRLQEIADTQTKSFRDNKVTHVVFVWPRLTLSSQQMLAHLWGQSQRWRLAAGNGKAVVFQVAVPGVKAAEVHDVNYRALAFAKNDQSKKTNTSEVVFPQNQDFWEKYLVGRKSSPLAISKAEFYVQSHFFEVLRAREDYIRLRKQSFVTLDGLGLWAGNLSAVNLSGAITPAITFTQIETFRGISQQPPIDLHFPMLAVRAARRAARNTPRDPASHFMLANTVSNQWIIEQSMGDPMTDNRRWAAEYQQNPNLTPLDYWNVARDQPRFSLRYNLRRAIVLAAYQHSALLDKDNPVTHWHLAKHLWREHILDANPNFVFKTRYLDVALEHAKRAKDEFDRVKNLSPNVEKLRKEIDQFHGFLKQDVANRLKQYRPIIANEPSLRKRVMHWLFRPYRIKGAKGDIEMPMSLAGEALKELEKVDFKKASKEDQAFILVWQLRLLAGMGKMKEVYDLLVREKDSGLLPTVVGQDIRIQLSGAMGDFQTISDIGSVVFKLNDKFKKDLIPALVPTRLLGNQNPAGVAILAQEYFYFQNQMSSVLREESEIKVMIGLMALEAGDVRQAEKMFEDAKAASKVSVFYPEIEIASRYLSQIRQANAKK